MVDQDSPPIPPTVPGADDDLADRALVERIRAAGIGSRAAWGELLSRYQDRLFSVCLRMVNDRERAADLTQDAFVKILQGLDSWDGRSRLSTWMIRVTMNVCLSHLRSEKLRRHASLTPDGGPTPARGEPSNRPPQPHSGPPSGGAGPGREPTPDLSVQHHDQRRRVLSALASLEPEQRAIIVLRDVQGLDYDQIAAAVGVAVGTVKSRLFRARLTLRELMEASEGKQQTT